MAASDNQRVGRQLPRWRWWTALPAWALALCGLLGLLTTTQPVAPQPAMREPVRFSAGAPLTDRLVLLLVPQLDERGTLALREALGGVVATPTSTVTIDRPDFASFDDVTLQLLAGNVTGGGVAPEPVSATSPIPDTLLRGVRSQGRTSLLIGPDSWRGLFGLQAGGTPVASSALGSNLIWLDRANQALTTPTAALIVVQLRDLTLKDLRDDAEIQARIAALGGMLTGRDALVVIGGGNSDALQVTFSGAGLAVSPIHTLPSNDFAPLCAVLLGAPYPFEARGRINWLLLSGSLQRKAEATAALARQRTNLVARAIPFGVAYPPELIVAETQHSVVDRALREGQYAYAYQLASSVLEQADRTLLTVGDLPTLPVPRRAAPWLAMVGVLVALYTLVIALWRRYWGSLSAALLGGLLALGVWLGSAYLLQRSITPGIGSVLTLVLAQALLGGGCAVWLVHLLQRLGGGEPGDELSREWRAVELLTLLAVLPLIVVAYRFGLPWRLRLDETRPLFYWRSALLAPPLVLAVGYFWGLFGVWASAHHRRRHG